MVAVAADGREAVREAVLHRPDVALMDLQMPGTDGFTAIRELARVAPSVRVCVLTMYDDDDSLFAAMRAGAQGYLLKGAEQEEIARAVRAVAAGEVIFGPGIAERVLHQLTSPSSGRDVRPVSGAHGSRARRCWTCWPSAMTTAAIARRLDVTPKTSATTCPTSWSSSRSPTAPKPRWWRAKRGWATAAPDARRTSIAVEGADDDDPAARTHEPSTATPTIGTHAAAVAPPCTEVRIDTT